MERLLKVEAALILLHGKGNAAAVFAEDAAGEYARYFGLDLATGPLLGFKEPPPKPRPVDSESPTVAPVKPGWTRTTRPEENKEGLRWRTWRIGVGMFAIVAEVPEALLAIYRNHPGTTYTATYGDHVVGRRFRYEGKAMEALSYHRRHRELQGVLSNAENASRRG